MICINKKSKVKIMAKLQFLTMPGCEHCAKGKKILDEVLPQFPNVEFEEIDMTTEKGQEMVQEYRVMSSPGIIIDGELFSSGCPDKEKLIEKLKSLK